jgi:hypothetical protein
VNEQLADAAVGHAVDLSRYSNGVVRRIIALLNRADADLFGQLGAALSTMTPEAFTVEWLEQMLVSVCRLNLSAYQAIQRELTTELQALAAYEAQYQYSLFRETLPLQVVNLVGVATVSAETAYAAAMSRPFQGVLLREWAQRAGEARMIRIRDALRMGFVEGQTVDQMVRRLRGTRAAGYADGLIEIDRRNAAAVVRTAVQHTAATVRDRFHEANAGLIKAIEWVSTLDSRTSHACFPGTTLALPIGNLLEVSRRTWNGDLIVVTTASGKQLRATPNHPVLTARGWRAIQELQPGTDVLYRVSCDVGSVAATENVEVPATFGAIFDALHEPSVSDIRVEGTAEVDFHGDGMAGYHEVNQPRTQSNLRLALESAFGKEVAEHLLVFVGVAGSLPSESHAEPVLVGLDLVDMSTEFGARAVEDGVQARLADLGHSTDVSWLRARDEQINDFRFISAACRIAATECRHDAGPLEDARDGRCGDAIGSTDGGCGLAAGIAQDDVVSVVREFFSGHVFNFSTSTAAYIADGFVVHNCSLRDGKRYTADGKHKPIGHKLPWGAGPGRFHWQCRSTSVAITKSWRELGIDMDEVAPGTRASMDGQVPAETTYADWIKSQSAERQDDILGPARGKLLREGGLTLDRFADDRGKWISLDALRQRNAEAFRRAGLK